MKKKEKLIGLKEGLFLLGILLTCGGLYIKETLIVELSRWDFATGVLLGMGTFASSMYCILAFTEKK